MAGNSKINHHHEDVLDGVLRGTTTACSSRNGTTSATTMTTMTSSTSGEMSLSSPRDLRGLYNNCSQQQQPPNIQTTKHPPNFKHLLCPPSTTITKASGTTNIKAVSVATTTTSATHIKLGML